MRPENGGGAPSLARYAPVVEALLLLAATLALAVGLREPALWFLAPVLLVTFTNRPASIYGLTWGNLESLPFHLATAGLVFGGYVAGHYVWGRYVLGLPFSPRLPAGLPREAFDQLLLVGLPEECFFRGYLQAQFDRVWGTPYRLLGARWGVGLPAAAALFALCHLVNGGPARLIVFFPGLWYGWLRARTGNVVVPAAYHAASNLLMQIMLASLGATAA